MKEFSALRAKTNSYLTDSSNETKTYTYLTDKNDEDKNVKETKKCV